MNTKTKNIVAILMATIIAMAMFAPAAMAEDVGIVVPITVPNAPPQVICKCEDPNPVTPDPFCDDKTVTICAGIIMSRVTSCDCNPLEPHVGESAVYCDRPLPDDPTCALYRGEFDMVYATDPAGEYRVVVTATDGTGDFDKLQNRFFYEPAVFIDLQDDVVFPDIEIGTDLFSNPCTIHNSGNCPIQIGFHYWGFENDATGAAAGDLIEFDVDGKWLTICTPWWDGTLPGYCSEMDVIFSLHVHPGLLPGAYTGTFDILAREAPTIRLENKKTDDIDLYDPIDDERYGELSYDIDTCDFKFKGYGLDDDPEYCLIYYTDDYPGANGVILGKNYTDGSEVTIEGNLGCIPYPEDLDYDRAGFKYAKIWLVPCDDYTDGVGLNKWNPSEILFEMETIQCCAQD
jgi:hypothetical protein